MSVLRMTRSGGRPAPQDHGPDRPGKGAAHLGALFEVIGLCEVPASRFLPNSAGLRRSQSLRSSATTIARAPARAAKRFCRY